MAVVNGCKAKLFPDCIIVIVEYRPQKGTELLCLFPVLLFTAYFVRL